MKTIRYIFLTLFLIVFINIYGQDSTATEYLRQKDLILINIQFDNLISNPKEVKTSYTRPSISWFWMYDLNFGQSSFSIAPGIGFSTKRFNTNISSWKQDNNLITTIPDNIEFKKNRLTVKYVDIPVEFRFIKKKKFKKMMVGHPFPPIKNGSIRMALGLDFGFLVKSKTEFENTIEKKKENGIDGLNPYKLDLTLRLGFGRINFSSSYSLISIMKNSNNQVIPFSFGVTCVIF